MQYTTNEAAQLARVQPVTIRQNIKRGNLAGIKRGRDWLIDEGELKRWAATRGRELTGIKGAK